MIPASSVHEEISLISMTVRIMLWKSDFTTWAIMLDADDKSKLKGSGTSRMRIWVTLPAKPPRPTKMLEEVKRSLDRVAEGRDEECPLLPWDQWQQQAL